MIRQQPFAAAIVGLGQVGMMFDLDPKRSGVWTHFTAYERLSDRFDLVAVCDVVPERLRLASERRSALRCYERMGDLLINERLDVISICTPPEFHLPQLEVALPHVKAAICEKPLGGAGEAASKIVEAYAARGVVLAVNYYKRYDAVIPTARLLLDEGAVGSIRRATGRYSGPLDAVGCHALDLLDYLVGPMKLIHTLAGDGECGTAVLFTASGQHVILERTGDREDLIFEVDIVGSEGRMQITQNCSCLIVERFQPSPRYSGYRELVMEPLPEFRPNERFLPLFAETSDALEGRGKVTSTGATALRIQHLLNEIESCLRSPTSYCP